MILPEQLFGNVGADDAHKADDTQEGNAHRGDERCQQHGDESQPVHMDAHGPGGGLTAEESIVFPGHDPEIGAADQYGDRSTDDYPYYKDLAKDLDARYMKLKLVEKYPVGQYPLKELKENGLTSVQGRSKATVQLMKYLEK